MKKIGFIGFGNMAMALAKAFVEYGELDGNSIFAYAPNQYKLKMNTRTIGINSCKDLTELIDNIEIVIIACKPYQIEGVLKEVGSAIYSKVVLSVAIGWDYKKYREYLPEKCEVQYFMPNTPASVGQGVFLFEDTNNLKIRDRSEIIDMFNKIGKVIELPSRLMNAGSAVSGCGPAFMDMIIEAMGDGAVKNGIPRDVAYELVCSTMIGAAKLKMESGLHPGELKDKVCSPGGTTIKGVASLEDSNIRSAFIKAIDAVIGKE